MSYSILDSCDKINSLDEAKRPVISPLLPVKGLRHDSNGDLTDDAIGIIMDGIKSLGVDVTDKSSRGPFYSEVKKVLCTINGQYQFLLSMYADTVASGKAPDSEIIDKIKEKNGAMRDIISLSRHIMDMPADSSEMVEGFLSSNSDLLTDNMRAELDSMSDDLKTFKIRNYEVSQEKNKSMNAYLNVYGFMNVVALGLLFYIASATP
jgi:hypothetical protein